MSDYTRSTVSTINGVNAETQKIQTAVNSKMDKSGGAFTGTVDMNEQRLINLPDATDPSEAMPLGQGLAIQEAAETAADQAIDAADRAEAAAAVAVAYPEGVLAGALAVGTANVGGGKAAVSITKLKDLSNILPNPDIVYNVQGFYLNTTVGGGQFKWDSSRSKVDHNGGTVIAPEALVAWSGVQTDIATLLNWTGSGTGCWVRCGVAALTPEMFGGIASALDNKLSFKKLFLQRGRIVVDANDYNFVIASDSDTILIPSNAKISCVDGATFNYSYFGSPLFASVESSNLSFTGYTINYSGSFGSALGSRTFLNWTLSVPAHRFCCDIAVLGCDNVNISGVHKSSTPSNVQNIGVYVDGKDDGVTDSENINIDISSDDRCQGAMTNGFKVFNVTVRQGRLPQNSDALYGAGHAIYDVIERRSSDGVFNVIDTGEYVDSLNLTESHSASIKNTSNVNANIISKRAAGPLNFCQSDGPVFDVDYIYDGTVNTASVGHIFYTGQGGPSNGVTINGSVLLTGAAHNSRIYDEAAGAAVNPLYDTNVNLSFKRAVSGTENPAFRLASTRGNYQITSTQTGSNNRVVAEFAGSSNLIVEINSLAGDARTLFTADTNSEVSIKGRLATRTNVVSLGSGGSSIVQNLAKHKNQSSIPLGVNPSLSFSLPSGGGGAYLLWVNVTNSDYNNARGGLYLIVHDNASVNDFTLAQLIGSQFTKGGSEISALNVSVTNDGTVSITTTAVESAYFIEYGYSELNRRNSMF